METVLFVCRGRGEYARLAVRFFNAEADPARVRATADDTPVVGPCPFVVSLGPPARDAVACREPSEFWPLVGALGGTLGGIAEQQMLLRRHVRELVHRQGWRTSSVSWAHA
jgi:hypothetical protein